MPTIPRCHADRLQVHRAQTADLVTVAHGQPMTTTERVAAAAGLKHGSVIKLVREHLADFEEFGEVRFQIRLNAQGSPTEYAELNEQQAALLFLADRHHAGAGLIDVALWSQRASSSHHTVTRTEATPRKANGLDPCES